ncbi:MAG: GAF domain-containing protein [Candidatus Sericytochromatia bacterium]|nr:GAF domain-containing protein [Candidatus Sericytochromatia bacterium]
MLSLPSRYAHLRPLGRGGMGEVHLVHDRERDGAVALKILHGAPDATSAQREESRFLFKQEFGAMTSLSHPNLVAGHDYGELADGRPFFTMEAVPGVDLSASERCPEASLRQWLPGLVAALSYLHARGYLHGDLKPENIRLRDDGLPKLMDLGLLSRPGRAGQPIRGSLHYVAPECIRGAASDPRADLYALGGVLYHLLAGRPAFDPDFTWAPVELLRAHLTLEPPPLQSLAPDVSEDMAIAVHRLLAKQPADRFRDGWELLDALGLDVEGERALGLLRAPMIAREEPLAELTRAVEGERHSLFHLVGGAGSGKSLLLAAWRAEAQLRGWITLSAQGLGAQAAPYAALTPWLKALVSRQPANLGRLAPILVRLLPDLEVPPAAALDGPREQLRLHAAIAELAEAAAPRATWLLDDADQLDPASQSLLTFLRARGESCHWHWVLTRADAPSEGERALVLVPLDSGEVRRMAQAMLGEVELPALLEEALPTLSGGNPGTVVTLLEHWYHKGLLVRAGRRWEIPDGRTLALPGGLRVVLESAFNELGAEAQQLGRLAALFGPSGSLAALTALADLPQGKVFAALAELESSETLTYQAGSFRFVRPAQALALASSFSEAEQCTWHARLAWELSGRGEQQPNTTQLGLAERMAIARHCLAGEQPEAAIAWTLSAARLARAISALPALLPLLQAVAGVAPLDDRARAELYDTWAAALRWQGDSSEALKLLENEVLPASSACDAGARAQCLTSLGIAYQVTGNLAKGVEALLQAVALADQADDVVAGVRARLHAGRTSYFSGDTVKARGLLADAVKQGREAAVDTMVGSAMSLYGYVLATSDPDQRDEGLALLEEAIAYNMAHDNPYDLHEACNNLGNVYLNRGCVEEARALFERCQSIAQKMSMANERGFALLNLGTTDLELGRLEEATAHALQAAELSRKQGRKFPEAYALAILGLARILQGELVPGLAQLDTALKLAQDLGNRYLELNVYARRLTALLHLGHLTRAAEELTRAEELAVASEDIQMTGTLAAFASVLKLATGDAQAADALREMVAVARRAQNPLALAQALRWEAESHFRMQATDAALNLLEEAAQLAESHSFQLLGAEILALWGRVLEPLDREAAAGRFSEGLSLAQGAACPVLEAVCRGGLGRTQFAASRERLEAPAQLNRLLIDLDEAARADYLVWPERHALLQHVAAPTGAGSLDRLRQLTEVIGAVTLQTDLDEVMQRALIALVELAAAERGFLLLYSGFQVTKQVFYGLEAWESDTFSTGLADQVLWSGEPVFVQDATGDALLSNRLSVQTLNLRTVLGVPLHDGEETLGVMLADSRRVNPDFGPAELDLALALGRQVAIAIRRAREWADLCQAYEEQSLLHRLSLRLLASDSLEAGFTLVATEALALCRASRALLLEGRSTRALLAVDAAGQRLPEEAGDVSSSVAGWVHDEGQPLHLVDAQADAAFQSRASIQALGLRSIYAVPVRLGDATLGVLYLDHPNILEENVAALATLVRLGEMLAAFWQRFPSPQGSRAPR